MAMIIPSRILSASSPFAPSSQDTNLKPLLRCLAILACAFSMWSTQAAAETNEQYCASSGYPIGSQPYKTCLTNVSDPNSIVYRQPASPLQVTSLPRVEVQADKGATYPCDGPVRLMNEPQFRYCLNKARKPSVPLTPNESYDSASAQSPASPAERSCAGYGFVKGTTPFSQCLMQLDVARQQAQLAQQQYQIQLQQYEQQVAAYKAQEAAIKREKKRQAWDALSRFGFGMAASQSPSFAGAMADGNAAMMGLPPVYRPPAPPPPPVYQDFTIRTANGGFAICTYDSALREVRCR